MRYGLIGEHLTHSFSKEIHESFAPYTYELIELAPDELEDLFKERDFSALNVTIPYKAAVIPYLDEVSDEAMSLRSVNTVVNRGGRLIGYNTDYIGLRDVIVRSGISLSDKKVLVFGSGATARVARLACRELGASHIYLVSRELRDGAISYPEAYEIHNDADIVINATPVGTYPDSSAISVDTDRFSKLSAFFDVVYNPLRTEAVLRTAERGAYAEGGLYMLVSQAVHASAIFRDEEADTALVEEVYKRVLREKENIVLTGMPCAGKTSVGKALAEALGREFVDIDEKIEERLGESISNFFATHTENEFRDIEAETVKQYSRLRGAVISTGGGTVLRDENVRALRSSGRIFFIDRSPSRLLPTESRPLAKTRIDIERLYKARYQLYLDTADVRINGDCSIDTVTALLIEEINK